MGRKGAIDCSCDDEDARIKPSDATVRLEAKNFTATAKHESSLFGVNALIQSRQQVISTVSGGGFEDLTTSHSSTVEGDGDQDKTMAGDEDVDEGGNEDEYKGRGEDEEDEDDDHDQEEESAP
ncbi:SRP-independent targeting protein 1-like [Gossypium hirsutum]|uniref:SRP-independent targeting protein 1-like n=1 Tax=Gossypium hirsutum TaxID=3635 RepID=A0ABM2ZI62_GOSHI|nr:SRP-independent targeting protein 1-like [Gossypium hirsutum]